MSTIFSPLQLVVGGGGEREIERHCRCSIYNRCYNIMIVAGLPHYSVATSCASSYHGIPPQYHDGAQELEGS